MVKINIFKSGNLLDSLQFKKQFTFLKLTDGESWFYDGSRRGEPGGILLWLKYSRDDLHDEYLITYVLPDWQMTIGNKVYERQFYMDIEINDVPITLEWQDYRLEMERV